MVPQAADLIPHNRWLNRPEYEAAALRVLRSGHVAQGPEVAAFEEELAVRFRPGEAAACVSSGTAALRLATRVLFEGLGDIGIFMSTYACAALCHASRPFRVRPIDISPATLNALRSCDIETHTYGVPTNVCHASIEDFTHAPGASLGGRPCGSLGSLSVISFGATKPLGIGAGGAVLGPADAIDEIKDRRDYDGKSNLRERFNWQMSDLHAAIGRERLRLLDHENEWRAETGTRYLAFCRVPIQDVAWADDEHGPHRKWSLGRVWYRYVIRVPDWRKAQAHFAARGIETINPLMPEELIHRMLGRAPSEFPNAEAAAETTLSLPIFPGMTDEQVRRVADALTELMP